MSNSNHPKAIEIKISTVVAVAVLLRSTDLSELRQQLSQMTAGISDFFENEFAVIDLAELPEAQPDWPALISLFREFGLNPVAVRNASGQIEADVIAAGLSIEVVGKVRSEPDPVVATEAEADSIADAVSESAATPEVPAELAPEPQVIIQHLPAMVVDTPVRGGQRIYARGADLIITAAVNHGAEVIADGSIHIYGALRGRALAGATGNSEARIFAAVMQPELISVAGIYRTFENGYPELPANQPSQVILQGDRLEIISIKPML